MLGRLARWLRLLGYDTLYFKEIDDRALITLAEAEKRVLLTRDTRLVNRRPIKKGNVSAVLIRADELEYQLRELQSQLELSSGAALCVICNQALAAIPKSEAAGAVPPYVYRTQSEFHRCPQCHRFYWPGTHWKRISEKIDSLNLTDTKGREEPTT